MYAEESGSSVVALFAFSMILFIIGNVFLEALMSTRINWNRTGVNQYSTSRAQKSGGYTAVITYSTNYTLTITGAGAPAPASYNTLRNAKNAFRKFLLSKP